MVNPVQVTTVAPALRSRRAWLVALVLAMVAMLWSPQPAAAVNALVGSTPPANAVLTTSPTTMQLVFRDELGAARSVSVACDGRTMSITNPQVGEGLRSLVFQLRTKLAPGAKCTVVWVVSNPDGTAGGKGQFTFSMQGTAPTTVPPADVSAATPASTPAATGNSSLNGPLSLARLVTNIGLAALFGALALIVLAWPEGVEYVLTVRYLRAAAIFAVAGSFLTVAIMTAQAKGAGLGGGLSPAGWGELTDITGGLPALLRFLLCVGSLWVVARPDRVNDPATQTAALGIPGLAVATLAFSRGTDAGIIGVLAGIVHALAMSVWFGGLALLTRVVLTGPGEEDLVHAVRGFRKISGLAIVLTAASGVALMYQMDWGHVFDTGHGQLLLFKAVATAGMVFVGLAAREFIRSRLSRVDSMSAGLANRLQRAVSLEAIVGVVILALTAWLTSLAPAGLAKAPVTVPDLGAVHRLASEQQGVVASIRLTERVGANAVYIDIDQPKDGLQGVELKFTPPPGSTGTGILLRVPLKGAGQAQLSKDKNLQLNVPGVWTVILTINGKLIDSTTVNVEPAASP